MVRGPGSENIVKPPPLIDPVRIHNLPSSSNCPLTSWYLMQYGINLSVVFGVVILSIAAAAVIWHVKPE